MALLCVKRLFLHFIFANLLLFPGENPIISPCKALSLRNGSVAFPECFGTRPLAKSWTLSAFVGLANNNPKLLRSGSEGLDNKSNGISSIRRYAEEADGEDSQVIDPSVSEGDTKSAQDVEVVEEVEEYAESDLDDDLDDTEIVDDEDLDDLYDVEEEDEEDGGDAVKVKRKGADGEAVDEDEEDEDDEDEYDDSPDADELESFDFNSHGEILLPGVTRLQKCRLSRQRRKLFKQNSVSLYNFIYPLHLHDKEAAQEPSETDGLWLFSVQEAVKQVGEAVKLGITTFILHPSVDESAKGLFADEGLNSEGLIPRVVVAIKEAHPQVQIIGDVSLSYYTSHGHDGIVEPETNFISNDITLSQIAKQACTLAYSGCDVISISDLVDGGVAVVREALDYEGFTDVAIMSKVAKYNSVLMTEQNKLLGIKPNEEVELASYLNDPSDSDVVLAKGISDLDSGADFVAVEPAGSYLDIVRILKDRLKSSGTALSINLPVVAIQTPGEVNLIKAGAKAGLLNEQLAVVEALRGFKRAGADMIVTPYAKQVATWLLEDMEHNGATIKLPEHGSLIRSTLENGLEYFLLPTKQFGQNLSVHLEVHSGSADELDDQLGLAHFCEHVTYMGSSRRAQLISNGARTNAYTDFHSTVFYAFIPSIASVNKSSTKLLMQMLLVMEDVIKAPMQFNQERMDKERHAILSEAVLINTLKHRKDKAAVEFMDGETRLPSRMPIGDLEMIKRYRLEDLRSYHRAHYMPSNATLYVVGDFDADVAKLLIHDVFAKIKNTRDDKTSFYYENLYRNTEKFRRRSLPPVKHDWKAPGPKIKIWENEQIKNLSLELATKSPLPTVVTYKDLFQEHLNKLVYRLVGFHFDIVSRDCGAYQSVVANSNFCINEGCKTDIIEIGTFPQKWKEAMHLILIQLKAMLHRGFSNSMLKLAADSYFSLLLKELSSIQSQNFVGHLIEANACKHAIMDPKEKLNIARDMLDRIHVDDVNQRALDIFYWLNSGLSPDDKNHDGLYIFCSSPPILGTETGLFDHYASLICILEESAAGLSAEALADTFHEACATSFEECDAAIPKEIFVPDQLYDENDEKKLFSHGKGFVVDKVPKPSLTLDSSLVQGGELGEVESKYISYLNEYHKVAEKLEYIKVDESRVREGDSSLERQVVSPELDKQKLGPYTASLMESSAPISSRIDPEKALFKAKPKDIGLELLQLENGICVNLQRFDVNLHHQGIIVAMPTTLELDDKEKLVLQKHSLLLASVSLMEGGQIGNRNRQQVELFCSRHLIDVNIQLDDDFLTFQLAFPDALSRHDNMESALQIIHHLIQFHEIEPDAHSRAVAKICQDRGDYIHDLSMFGVGDVVNYMSNGILSRHEIDLDLIKSLDVNTLQKHLNLLFRPESVEVSICTNEDVDVVKAKVCKYLGGIDFGDAQRFDAATARYKLGEDIFSKPTEESDLQNSGALAQVDEASPQTAYSPPVVPGDCVTLTLEDKEDRALVILAGHAPNASGILPDGTLMATVLEDTFRAAALSKENAQAVDLMAKARRELWLHPAFPMASAMLLEHLLNSRFFSILRNCKNLAYETSVKTSPLQVQFAGFYTVMVHASRATASVILKEGLDVLDELVKDTSCVTQELLDYCKGAVLAKLEKLSKDGLERASRMVGLQLLQMPLKNHFALSEFDVVLERITLDDVSLLLSSQVYGFDRNNVKQRLLVSSGC